MSQFVESKGQDWATPVAPIAPAAPATSEPVNNNGPYRSANDWTKGCRLTWTALNRTFAASKYSAVFFAILPSLYLSTVMIGINVKWGNDTQLVLPLRLATQFFGVLAGFTYFFNILTSVAILKRWPGVLSFCAWTQEVIEHFFIVSFIILVLASGSLAAFFSSYRIDWNTIYLYILSPVFACFFFAVMAYSLSASVSVAFRRELSGLE